MWAMQRFDLLQPYSCQYIHMYVESVISNIKKTLVHNLGPYAYYLVGYI